jgi:hypothetical protein
LGAAIIVGTFTIFSQISGFGKELTIPEKIFMNSKIISGTNILIYAYNWMADKETKYLRPYFTSSEGYGIGIFSTQVLQESYLNLTQKIVNPLPKSKAMGGLEC